MRKARVDFTALLSFAGFLVLAGAMLGTYFLSRESRRADAWIVHTLSVEERLSDILARLQDAEIGQRDYLATGADATLRPYREARATLLPDIGALRRTVADNPGQVAAAAVLRACVERRMVRLGQSIALVRAGRRGEAAALVDGQSGANQTSCRPIVDAMKAAEGALLKVRADRAARQGLIFNIWLAVSALLIAALALVSVRAASGRARAAAAAQEATALAHAQFQQEAQNRSAAEAQLRQLQKMESIGQLTGGIAHDFNNMLAVVIGSLDLARRRVADPARITQHIDAAMIGARRAAQLTAQLLAFGRRQPLAPAPIDASQLVRRLSELLRRTIGPSIRFSVEPAIGLWPSNVDTGQLEGALVNLCVNARDAMPEGGRLTVSTANVRLDAAFAATHPDVPPGDYIRIVVEDSGTGMTADVAERAFEPFFTTKSVGKGSGLGLSQVYGFVKQSGGHVAIDSAPGRGTSICLFLPRYTGNVETQPAASTTLPNPLAGARDSEIVLVVDDETQLRELAVEALRELGYIVLSAGSGEEALELLETQPRVDLLLTDVLMPGMDGRVLAKRAAALRPEMKLLLMSGYPRDGIAPESTPDPLVDLIAKPFDLATLAARVRRAIDGPAAAAA